MQPTTSETSTAATTAVGSPSKRRSVTESFAMIRTPEFWKTGARPWRRKRSKSSDHIQLLQNDYDHNEEDSDHGDSCSQRTFQDYFKQPTSTMPSRKSVLRPSRLLWPGPRVFQRRGKRDAPLSPSTQPRHRSLLIPAEHPLKILWDLMTVLISCYYAYATHTSIRDRKFGWQHSSFFMFSEIWFFIDILLNFCAERKISNDVVLRDPRKVWARYLTTWFAVDVLSLVPWESLYVQPIIEQQNRRSIWKKTLFRSRAVLRFCRRLGGRHVKLFGQVARHSKLHAGVGALRLVRLLVKYVPKYILFFRNMKAIVAVRALRQVIWFRKVWRHNPLLWFWKARQAVSPTRQHFHNKHNTDPLKDDAETSSIVSDYDDDDDLDHGGMSWWDESTSGEERSTKMRTLVRLVEYDAKFIASKLRVQNHHDHHGWTEDDDPY